MSSYSVYMHTFPNGKQYIGITCQSPERRWRDGKGYEGQLVYDAILKYGWRNIRHEVLFRNLTKEEAENKEIALIRDYETTSHKKGYNVELGGKSVGRMTDETKKKISEAKRGKYSGANHWNYGHHLGEETKEKIRKAHLGMKASKETLRKMSERFSGDKNPMFNTKLTSDHKKKLQDACVKACSKAVLCVESNIIYISAAEAQRQTGINARAIGYVCNQDPRYKRAGGLHWRYAERSI